MILKLGGTVNSHLLYTRESDYIKKGRCLQCHMDKTTDKPFLFMKKIPQFHYRYCSSGYFTKLEKSHSFIIHLLL